MEAGMTIINGVETQIDTRAAVKRLLTAIKKNDAISADTEFEALINASSGTVFSLNLENEFQKYFSDAYNEYWAFWFNSSGRFYGLGSRMSQHLFILQINLEKAESEPDNAVKGVAYAFGMLFVTMDLIGWVGDVAIKDTITFIDGLSEIFKKYNIHLDKAALHAHFIENLEYSKKVLAQDSNAYGEQSLDDAIKRFTNAYKEVFKHLKKLH